MKRTTLKLDESLLRRLKQQAAAEGRSLQDLANQLLRRALATQDHAPYILSLTGWEATAQPGVDILDRDALFDLMSGR
ncbi:MAG TPA: CopG family transcriptional regulator [Gemmatimonadales bacterium]